MTMQPRATARIGWTSQAARDFWFPRLQQLQAMVCGGNVLSEGEPACCVRAAALGHEPIIGWAWGGEAPTVPLTIPSTPETNPLLRPLGIMVSNVEACEAGCPAMTSFVGRRFEEYKDAGLGDVGHLLREVLDWPVKWTSLNGIAETVTPVMRFISAGRVPRNGVLHYLGTTFPAFGAKGLRFPFRQPTSVGS